MIRNYITFFILFYFLFYGLRLFSQNEINKDSLLNIVNINKENIETTDALNHLAKYYFNRNIDSAILFSKKALLLSQKLSYKQGIADSYRNTGRAFTISGNYKKSFDFFYKALEINEAMNDSLSIGKDYSNIGIVHYYQRDLDKSLIFLKKSLAIYKAKNYEIGLARVYNNIGLVYSDLGKSDSAEMCFNKTIEFAQKTNNLQIETSALGNVARIFMIKKDFNKAIEILLKIPDKAKEINNNSILSVIYANIATAYLSLSKERRNISKKNKYLNYALKYNISALNNAEKLNSNSLRAYAYQGLTQVYKTKKDYKNAFENLEKYTVINDSIFNQEKSEAIVNIEAKYENEKKQLVIKNLQKEKQADFVIIQKRIQLF